MHDASCIRVTVQNDINFSFSFSAGLASLWVNFQSVWIARAPPSRLVITVELIHGALSIWAVNSEIDFATDMQENWWLWLYNRGDLDPDYIEDVLPVDGV